MRDKFEIYDWFRDTVSLDSMERKPSDVDLLDFARLFNSFFNMG